MRQIWAMGIHDKQLIFIIKRILKAPIRMPDGTTLIPDKGTPQGGIISPLLANIVLNELDKWVESQWQNHPLVKEYGYERKIRNSITFDRSKAFLKMRKTGLKEMYIVRYADDFRIFCRNKEDALRTKEAVTAWITERLRLEVSPEKTRIVNVRKRYSEFLGFKIRVRPKSRKYIVQSHICDKSWNWKGKTGGTGETNCPTFRGKKTFGRNTAVQFNGSGNTELFSTCHLHQH